MQRHYFAPVPNRAYLDRRLHGTHLRVLGCVAMHDRMGVNGRHCILSVRRIGEKIGVDHSNVANAVRELAAWGYLQRFVDPHHRQRQQLGVLYDDDADQAALKSQNRGAADPRSEGDNRGAVDPHRRYPPEGDRIYAAEAAPNMRSAPEEAFADFTDMDGVGAKLLGTSSVASFLAQLDRATREGFTFSHEIADQLYARVDEIHTAYDYSQGDAVAGLAYRLLNTDFTREAS